MSLQLLLRLSRFNIRRLRNIEPESWIRGQGESSLDGTALNHKLPSECKDWKEVRRQKIQDSKLKASTTKGYQTTRSTQKLQNLSAPASTEVLGSQSSSPKEFDVQPVSPCLHSLPVSNPKLHTKIYRWCSCGLSQKQPLCDNSHKNTAFKPLKFTVEQKIDRVAGVKNQLDLCGCKLTTKAPFCDGQTCKQASKSKAQ